MTTCIRVFRHAHSSDNSTSKIMSRSRERRSRMACSRLSLPGRFLRRRSLGGSKSALVPQHPRRKNWRRSIRSRQRNDTNIVEAVEVALVSISLEPSPKKGGMTMDEALRKLKIDGGDLEPNNEDP